MEFTEFSVQVTASVEKEGVAKQPIHAYERVKDRNSRLEVLYKNY